MVPSHNFNAKLVSEYCVWNECSGFPFFEDDDALTMKMHLDNAILMQRVRREIDKNSKDVVGVSEIELDVQWSSFPKPVSRLQHLDIVAEFGGLWFFLPALSTFHFLLMDIVTEKHEKRRLALRMMGMGVTAFWLAWVVAAVALSILSATILTISAHLAQFNVFVHADVGVMWLLFFMYTWSLSCIALLVGACTDKIGTAQAVSWAIILVGFLFQAMLSIADALLIKLLHATVLPTWIPTAITEQILRATSFILALMQMYPPFHMAKAYNDVAAVTAGRFDILSQVFTEPQRYEWHQVFVPHLNSTIFDGYDYRFDLPSLMSTWGRMIIIGLAAVFLAWYFEHVLGSRSDGVTASPWFIFDPYMWRRRVCFHCFKSKKNVRNVPSGQIEEMQAARVHPGILFEEVRKRFTRRPGLWIFCGRRLCCFKCRRCRDFKVDCARHHIDAVDSVSAGVEVGELLGLLGHNGAGKTTLIRMLTGVITPSHGSVSVHGKLVARASVKCGRLSKMQEPISSTGCLIGVCPQQNILWPQVTVEEHLYFYAAVKGITGTKSAIMCEIQEKLQLVGLLDARRVWAGRFADCSLLLTNNIIIIFQFFHSFLYLFFWQDEWWNAAATLHSDCSSGRSTCCRS